MLGAKAQQIEPQDPHYETYEDARGKKRQRKRAMPTGLSKRDEKVLVSRLANPHSLKDRVDESTCVHSVPSEEEHIISTKDSGSSRLFALFTFSR